MFFRGVLFLHIRSINEYTWYCFQLLRLTDNFFILTIIQGDWYLLLLLYHQIEQIVVLERQIILYTCRSKTWIIYLDFTSAYYKAQLSLLQTCLLDYQDGTHLRKLILQGTEYLPEYILFCGIKPFATNLNTWLLLHNTRHIYF